jgi:hypothetical protein
VHDSNSQFGTKTVGWRRPSFLVATPEAARLNRKDEIIEMLKEEEATACALGS